MHRLKKTLKKEQLSNLYIYQKLKKAFMAEAMEKLDKKSPISAAKLIMKAVSITLYSRACPPKNRKGNHIITAIL